jgi:hypothetical protein
VPVDIYGESMGDLLVDAMDGQVYLGQLPCGGVGLMVVDSDVSDAPPPRGPPRNSYFGRQSLYSAVSIWPRSLSAAATQDGLKPQAGPEVLFCAFFTRAMDPLHQP